MAAASRDKRRSDLAKFVETYTKLEAPEGDAIEQAVWVILARNGTKEGATRAWKSLQARYLDINEIRVAKLSEIAPIIARHVRNDAEDVAWYLRGFLREIMRTQHQMAFEFAEAMTPDQIKKYLQSLESFRQEVAMAMALHFCVAEIEAEAGLAPLEGETKPRKRAEKDVTVSANRLRLLFTCGAHGTITTTGKEVNSARAFVKAWSFGPLEPRPVEEPEPIPVILASDLEDAAPDEDSRVSGRGKRKVAARAVRAARKAKAAEKPAPKAKAPRKTASKKTATKKSATRKVAKKVAKKTAAKTTKKSSSKSSSRSGGGTRPRPARPARKRSDSKKSSRRS